MLAAILLCDGARLLMEPPALFRALLALLLARTRIIKIDARKD